MAKTSRHSGDSYTGDELNDPHPPVKIRRAVLGEVDRPSVGGDSSQSSGKEENSNDKPIPSRRSPAPTMANHSRMTEPETSDAVSTAGNGPVTPVPQSARKAPVKKAAKKAVKKTTRGQARARTLDDDF